MENNAQKDIIGTAASNPVALSGGAWVVRSGQDVINEALTDILATQQGTTFMHPEYGSRLNQTLFLPNDSTTHSIQRQIVVDAIRANEPRVRVTSVQVQESEEENVRVNIFVDYTILATAEQGSLVFPFYEELPN